MQEMWFLSLDWEDPLEKEMATTPVFLPGKSHGQKEPGRLQSMGSQRAGHGLATKQQHMCVCIYIYVDIGIYIYIYIYIYICNTHT